MNPNDHLLLIDRYAALRTRLLVGVFVLAVLNLCFIAGWYILGAERNGPMDQTVHFWSFAVGMVIIVCAACIGLWTTRAARRRAAAFSAALPTDEPQL